jgi:hypothetical protein
MTAVPGAVRVSGCMLVPWIMPGITNMTLSIPSLVGLEVVERLCATPWHRP